MAQDRYQWLAVVNKEVKCRSCLSSLPNCSLLLLQGAIFFISAVFSFFFRDLEKGASLPLSMSQCYRIFQDYREINVGRRVNDRQ